MFDHENKRVRISQRAPFIIDKFGEDALKKRFGFCLLFTESVNFEVKPEYGSYMLELTPTHPYNQYACSLNGIESNMKNRRLAASGLWRLRGHDGPAPRTGRGLGLPPRYGDQSTPPFCVVVM